MDEDAEKLAAPDITNFELERDDEVVTMTPPIEPMRETVEV